MTNFDEYVTKMEERREREKTERWNRELARRLREHTREDAWRALYAALIFTGAVSDVLPAHTQEERALGV